MKRKSLMKILSAILSVIMVLPAVPLSVFASDVEAAEGLKYDISEAEAKINIVLSEMNVKKDDVITVTVELTTNFPTGNLQLPVIFDKTQFEIVGQVTDKSYFTVAEGSSFASKNYVFGGRADKTNGFQGTSDPDKWNTEEAMAQYGYAYITATYNGSVGSDDDTLAIPQGEEFVTFRLKALADVTDARNSVFVSPDWIKTEDNKKGLLTIGFSETIDNKNPMTYIPYGVSYEFETVYHDYQPTVTAPTCTEEGYTTYTCTLCGDSYIEDEVPAIGHTEVDAVVENEVAADCVNDGSYDTVIYCAVCGEELSRETHTIPALGHDDVSENKWETDENSHFKTCSCGEVIASEDHVFEWVTDEKATCTSTGLKHEECEACGYVRNENTVIVVPHNTQTYAAVEPTCTSAGNIEYYICRDCGKCFSDSECANEISESSVMLSAKGHNYIAVVTPPTETEQGYTKYTCDGCGDSYKENFVDPSAKLTVSGTVTSFGSETDEVTVELTLKDSDEVLYLVTVTGNLAEYTFEDVDKGEYIMSVSKNNHVTRTYEITVGESGISRDVKIHLKGDINGDGKVNTMDVARANANAKGVTPLADYEFRCADINGDNKVNTLDVARMNAHAKGVTALW